MRPIYTCCHYQRIHWSIFGHEKADIVLLFIHGSLHNLQPQDFFTFVVLFWCLQAPNCVAITVWCKKGGNLESFLAGLSVQRKPGIIWVCMSPFIVAICIITRKSSSSGFCCSMSFVSGGIQFVPWRTCWLYLALLWCPCPPLPGADVIRDLYLHLGWCVRARCHSMEHPGILLLFVVRLLPSWCSLLWKAETRGIYDHSVSGSQSGKCLLTLQAKLLHPFSMSASLRSAKAW